MFHSPSANFIRQVVTWKYSRDQNMVVNMWQIVGPCISVHINLLFPDIDGFFHLSCPAVPFLVHYFGSSLVDDMIVPVDMVRDCRSVHLSESFPFCSYMDFADCYLWVLSMFFQSFTKIPACFSNVNSLTIVTWYLVHTLDSVFYTGLEPK